MEATDDQNQVSVHPRSPAENTKSAAVLACGYREISSSKSGLSFPTFLVELPTGQTVWRSKRDFLLLGRSKEQQQLPFKSCLRKLAEKAPWVRPDRKNNTADLPECCSSTNKKNNYHVSMKKTILQLDQFLKRLQQSDHAQDQDAWNLFCRHEDTEGLIPLECDKEVIQQTSQQENTPTATSAAQSSQLGQYFCSEENATRVVETALSKLLPTLRLVDSNEDAPSTPATRKLLFVEPSCGHGDIVAKLVQELQEGKIINGTNPNNYDSFKILGLDIDPNAIEACRRRNFPIDWVSFDCQNFLKSKYKSPYHDDDTTVVCCLGGPPYTTGAGAGSDIQRDLPMLFVHHCIAEWQASLICFLLPDRYKNIDNLVLPNGYESTIVDLSSSTFYFQGTVPVTQPSIILCISKTTMDR